MEQKNKIIEDYIINISKQVNSQYNGLIDDDKISRAIEMFKDSNDDLETEIIPKINELVQEVIDNYLEFKKQIEEVMRTSEQEQFDELATLDLNTDKNGVFLSQQQIDLLMITELESKEQLKDYVEKICSQFPYKSVEEIIINYDSITTPEQLEEAKRTLYKKYQDSIIDYISTSLMSNVEKARVKLERLGINGEELEACLSHVSQGKINETFTYLGQKYGDEFITKFNHSMNDDFDNVRSVSYDEMKSLSEMIKRDKSIDTIIVATGKFDNSIYQTMNGKVFDPYLTSKALQFCYANKKHMGLTNWKNSPDGLIYKYDVVIAKNYLNEEELNKLNDLTNMFLVFAEDEAKERHIMTMQNWINATDDLLKFRRKSVLKNSGTISHQQAMEKAENEYEKYRLIQDQHYISTMDEFYDKYLRENNEVSDENEQWFNQQLDIAMLTFTLIRKKVLLMNIVIVISS